MQTLWYYKRLLSHSTNALSVSSEWCMRVEVRDIERRTSSLPALALSEVAADAAALIGGSFFPTDLCCAVSNAASTSFCESWSSSAKTRDRSASSSATLLASERGVSVWKVGSPPSGWIWHPRFSESAGEASPLALSPRGCSRRFMLRASSCCNVVVVVLSASWAVECLECQIFIVAISNMATVQVELDNCMLRF